MAISSLQNPKFQSRLNSGEVNDSGYIYVYTVAGTYNDPADQVTVWSDKDKTNPLSQPIQLDPDGTKEIWFDGTVEIRVEESDTTLLDTIIGVESSPSATVTGNFNLVQNGSFEIDTDGDGAPDSWTLAPVTSATIAIDDNSGGQSHGSNGLKFTSSGVAAGSATSDLFDVPDGRTLSVAWSFKCEDANIDAATNNIVINWYDYNGDAHSGTPSTTIWSITASAPTSWTDYFERASVPAGATQAKLVINAIVAGGSEATVGKSVWFDNIQAASNIDTEITFWTQDTLVSPTASDTLKFTGMTTKCKKFTVHFDNVTLSAAQTIYIKLSDATTGYHSSGYTGGFGVTTQAGAASANTSTIHILTSGTSAAQRTGEIVFSLMDETTNKWTWNGAIFMDTTNHYFCHGSIDLDDVLNGIDVLTSSGTMTAGAVNVTYEDTLD